MNDIAERLLRKIAFADYFELFTRSDGTHGVIIDNAHELSDEEFAYLDSLQPLPEATEAAWSGRATPWEDQ